MSDGINQAAAGLIIRAMAGSVRQDIHQFQVVNIGAQAIVGERSSGGTNVGFFPQASGVGSIGMHIQVGTPGPAKQPPATRWVSDLDALADEIDADADPSRLRQLWDVLISKAAPPVITGTAAAVLTQLLGVQGLPHL